jgi:hypothetical protein
MSVRSTTLRQLACLFLLSALALSAACRSAPPTLPPPSPNLAVPEPPPAPVMEAPEPPPPPPSPEPAPPPPFPKPEPSFPDLGSSHPAARPAAPAHGPAKAEPGEPPLSPDAMFDRLREMRDRLPRWNGAFVVPARMKVGEVGTAQLALSARKSLAELVAQLSSREGVGETQAKAERIQVSPFVKATLRGEPAITVAAQTEEEQSAEADREPTWRWNITAVRPGKQSLTVTLTALVKIDGDPRSLELVTWEKPVQIVAVTPPNPFWKFLSDYPTFVLGSLILPAMGAGWKVLRDRKKKPVPPAPAVS